MSLRLYRESILLTGDRHRQPTSRPYARPTREAPAANGNNNRNIGSSPLFTSAPNLTPNPAASIFPCRWNGCVIHLDDDSKGGIKRHLQRFHEPDLRISPRCPCRWLGDDGRPCEKDFSGVETLAKHIATVHLQSSQLKCPYCGSSMSRPDALTRHLQATCRSSDRPLK
ncbi:hypothetical protein DAEQUDRAFT_210402 [Daedalea quercina L-15889]|uniref:C2H2-type domain-containing protein n=1 Tax=Daedalea quercina L-15889 TaxID=1314783 RepID=A0A165RAQ0_9APHY|nr:hypothetical protein DAEQUDRAFT_210402 [Daedalea quercina L-15889]